MQHKTDQKISQTQTITNLPQQISFFSVLPDEIVTNIASRLNGNLYNFMRASKTISSIAPWELNRTYALIKKYFPQDYSWFYQSLNEKFPLPQSEFSFKVNTEVHCNVLINLIKSRLTLDTLPVIEQQTKKAGLKSGDIFTEELNNDLTFIIEKITETITWEQILYLEKLNQLTCSAAIKLKEEEVFFFDKDYLNLWIEKSVAPMSQGEAQEIARDLLSFINKKRTQLPFEEIKQKLQAMFTEYGVGSDEYFAKKDIHFLLNFAAHKEYIEKELKTNNIEFKIEIFNKFEQAFKNQYCPRENDSYLLNARRDIRDELKSIFNKHKINAPYYFITNNDEEFYKNWNHHFLFIQQLDIPNKLRQEIIKEIDVLKGVPNLSTQNIKEKLKSLFDKHKLEYGEYFVTRDESMFFNWQAHLNFISHLDLDEKKKQSLIEEVQNLQRLSRITMPTVSEKNYHDEFFPIIETYKNSLMRIMERYNVTFTLPITPHVLIDWTRFEQLLTPQLTQNPQAKKIRLECFLLHQVTLRGLLYKNLFNLLIALGRNNLLTITDLYYHFLNTSVLMPRLTDIIIKRVNLKLPFETYFSLFRDFLGQEVDFPLNDVEYLLWGATDKYGLSVFRLAKKYNNQKLLNILWTKHGLEDPDESLTGSFYDFKKVIYEPQIILLQWKVATNQPAHDFSYKPKDLAPITYTDGYSNRLIHYAALNKDLSWLIKIIDVTIKANISLDTPNKAGNSPLQLAILDGNYAAVDLLLQAGATFKPNTNLQTLIQKLPPSMDCSAQRITPLHIIVRYMPVEVLNALDSQWLAEINVQNHLGQTPLHIALEIKNVDKIEWLLKNGANVELKDQFGMSVLDYLSTKLFEDPIQKAFSKFNSLNHNRDSVYSMAQAILIKNPILIKLFLMKHKSILIMEYFEAMQVSGIQMNMLNQALINGFKKYINPHSEKSQQFNDFFIQVKEATLDEQIQKIIKKTSPDFLINLLALAKLYQSFSKSKNTHKVEKLKKINSIVEHVVLGTPINVEELKSDKKLYKIASSLIKALARNNNNNLEPSKKFNP